MRERTTWNRDMIANKQADDPRAMNQDHHSQQPAADAYVIGDPSTFAEDVHPAAGTWKAEQEGGETKRDEIGMPAMRGDTFNHPEKTAGDETVLKKADLCVETAKAMLPKTASEGAIEDQALALMNLPDADLIDTANRLAVGIAQDDGDDDDDDDDGKQAGELPPALKEHMKKKEEANGGGDDKKDDDKADAKGDDDKGDDDKGQQGDKEAFTLGEGATYAASAIQAMQNGDQQGMQAAIAGMIQGMQQQQGQGCMSQDQMQGMVQEQLQQAMQQMQAPQGSGTAPAMQDPQQGATAIEGIDGSGTGPMGEATSEDQMLDQMLQQDMGGQDMGQQVMAGGEMDIQLDGAQMDVGETPLGPEDAVLQQLFASHPEVQNAAHAQEIQTGINPLTAPPAAPAAMPAAPAAAPAVTAGTTRTASTRTVGTKPTAGVSQLGGGAGGPAPASDVDRLSALWRTAPDVSDVFNQ